MENALISADEFLKLIFLAKTPGRKEIKPIILNYYLCGLLDTAKLPRRRLRLGVSFFFLQFHRDQILKIGEVVPVNFLRSPAADCHS
jgi:hypothetical protein